MEPDEAEGEAVAIVPSNEPVIRDLIYTVRGTQVMIDSDLARLYQVETGAVNRAAKRNESRFPEDFRFQLTREEYDNLMCQIGISSFAGEHGGRRKLPFVYTEQGVAMLPEDVLTELGVETVAIPRTQVETAEIPKAAIGASEIERAGYETIDITVLRRGVIGVNKVGYVM